MGFSKGSKGGGKPKAKAAPIARPSYDYAHIIAQREYNADEKVEREEIRRLEAKARQLARECGIAADLGAAGLQWEQAAKHGTAPPPPGSGSKGVYGGKGCGKEGKRSRGTRNRGGKASKGGKAKSGGKGSSSKAAMPPRNHGHLHTDSSQAWGNFTGVTQPVRRSSAWSYPEPPAVRPESAADAENSRRVVMISSAQKPILRSAAEVAWDKSETASGTARGAHGGSADVPAYRGGSDAAAPTAGSHGCETSSAPDAPPWNGTSWHEKPWHDNSSWSDDRWIDNSWNWCESGASTASTSTSNALLSESKATNEVVRHTQHCDDWTADDWRRADVADSRPHVASGEHCEVLKHSQTGCAVVSLESTAIREALMTFIEGRSSAVTAEITICGVPVTVQRHTDKDTGIAVETDIWLGWDRSAWLGPVDDIAKAIDATLAGLVLPKSAPPSGASEEQRRKLKTYLWSMAAQSLVQKGKTVLRYSAANNMVSSTIVESIIAEFEANTITQNDEDDYDDEYEDDDTDAGWQGHSAATASHEHADSQQAHHFSGKDAADVAVPDDSDDDLG